MSEPLEGVIPGFDIKRTIAKGKMATTYRAVQRSLNRVVAPKLLDSSGSTEYSEDRETLINRFRQEGEIVSRMDHPHIVEAYGVGHTDSPLYMHMEYLGGGDLAARVESGITPLAALDIVIAPGKALAYAHDLGVVHRDVKPTNVLFRRDGTALLSDFGIAKRLNSGVEITTVGMLLGSPVYMSPEQVQGRPLHGRTDIYSLGVMLYEMLTGRPPFYATSPFRVMMMHARDPIPLLPVALRTFTSLCERLLAKDVD